MVKAGFFSKTLSKYKRTVIGSHIFNTDFIIGNYRMQRETPEDAWTITEVAQMSSVQAWPKGFINESKWRLFFATGFGWNFNTIWPLYVYIIHYKYTSKI